ncbi:hypothetical protein [Anaerotignum sp.]
MKKLLSKTSIAAVVTAAILSTGVPMAYAAEIPENPVPAVTLNGESTDIRAKYIKGKLYFSVTDFWSTVQGYESKDIKWYDEEQILSNGSIFLSVKDQNWYRYANKTTAFSDPIIYENGTVWVSPSFVKDTHTGNIKDISVESRDNTLSFKKTFWVFPNETSCDYRLPVIGIDPKNNLPDFASVSLLKEKGFSESKFHILTQELDDNKIVFAYISKTLPQNFLLVTVSDGYVSCVLDNNGVFTYQDYGLRNS